MWIACITTVFAVALAPASTGLERVPGASAVPPPVAIDPIVVPTRMAEEGIKRLKAAGVAGLCDVAFAEGKTVNNPADRAGAEIHFQRLRDAMTARYGKSTGELELIRKEMIGNSLVRFTYLEKLERGPVVWRFIFYRVDGGWKWKDLGTTDNLETEYRVEK
jgi:hypothetical protein